MTSEREPETWWDEVERESARLIRNGFTPWLAKGRAIQIVSARRKQSAFTDTEQI